MLHQERRKYEEEVQEKIEYHDGKVRENSFCFWGVGEILPFVGILIKPEPYNKAVVHLLVLFFFGLHQMN